MASELFKDDAARERVARWYPRVRAQLRAETTTRTFATQAGQTHVLIGGPADAPPVVVLHGALASSALIMRELEALFANLRVYAVDVIGQSVMSADARLSVKDDAYGAWLAEVFDALQLDQAAVVGVSWGGFVALRFAAFAPERITRLALLVPAGIVQGSPWAGLTKMAWPMTRFLLSPSPRTKARFLANLLTTLDDDWSDYLGDAFTSYNLKRMPIPPRITPDALARLRAPVLVVGADEDVSFPGAPLLARAKALFGECAELELLTKCKHSPPTTAEFRSTFGARLARFLSADAAATP